MAQTPYCLTVAIHVDAHDAEVARAPRVMTPAASATNDSNALKVCTTSEFMGTILTPSVANAGGSGRIIG